MAMAKKTTTDFEKKHGFVAPPRPHFEGTWAPYFMRVEATLTCKSCGGQINLSLKGDPTRLHPETIGRRVLRVAEERHDCPAINLELEIHKDRYYADLRRGMEKKHEADYKKSLTKDNDGKSTRKA